jgi:hypothetical protein
MGDALVQGQHPGRQSDPGWSEQLSVQDFCLVLLTGTGIQRSSPFS